MSHTIQPEHIRDIVDYLYNIFGMSTEDVRAMFIHSKLPTEVWEHWL